LTLEISHGSNLFSYRTDPDDACAIQWRHNQANARWKSWGEPFASALEARQALLTLTQGHTRAATEAAKT
jgi:hypothetical protein